ncbi:DUF2986 domain-containing protein [Psychromonas sp. Urea-02u-13]|uniref:DUF2986 domain-containing protein n=1 Tax=Psychromonas sp. Urea-02u-13 TaxID=2058326 RepID=UPI000C347D09|nr:DUF2986 domain-containing protein [Psychromonas sp. Urea-02u-13]PKG40034.1 DUF2986 domain-containing protein [Psychromonas sp. Urea-02u-13]
MNRKKKLNKILNSRIKKMNAKKGPNSKATYVSKAEREKLALAQENETEQAITE